MIQHRRLMNKIDPRSMGNFFQVKSMDEAIHWTKRFLEVLGKGECELRPIFEASDFSPEAFTPQEAKREAATHQQMKRNAATR